MLLNRKRKTKEPCPRCGLHPKLCVCYLIPNLEFKTKVVLIIHSKELKRTTNTGLLAIESLKNSEVYIRGQGSESDPRSPLDLSHLLTENYETLFLFPSESAVELNSDLINKCSKPIQLIIPDGNWRQASKVYNRHPELKSVPKVKLSSVNLAPTHLRAEHFAEGLSTLEAVAQALAIIEGSEAVRPLHRLYSAKLEATLIGRGKHIKTTSDNL